jgi:hypothetical protein
MMRSLEKMVCVLALATSGVLFGAGCVVPDGSEEAEIETLAGEDTGASSQACGCDDGWYRRGGCGHHGGWRDDGCGHHRRHGCGGHDRWY